MSLVNPNSYFSEPLDVLGFFVSFALFHVTLWSYKTDGQRVYAAVTQGRTGWNCFRNFAPGWLYAIMWFVLNTLLGVAAWLTWRRPLAYEDGSLWTATMAVWFVYWVWLKLWNAVFNMPMTWLYVAHVVVAAGLNLVLIVLTCYASHGSNDFVVSLLFLVATLVWSLFALSYAVGMYRMSDKVEQRFAALRSAEKAQLGYM